MQKRPLSIIDYDPVEVCVVYLFSSETSLYMYFLTFHFSFFRTFVDISLGPGMCVPPPPKVIASSQDSIKNQPAYSDYSLASTKDNCDFCVRKVLQHDKDMLTYAAM